MNYNKTYFLLYFNSGVIDGGTGYVYNINLRNRLSYLYDKYNAFSIKLESYICRSANSSFIVDDFLLLHMSGLNFINGYDTCQKYSDSKVIEMIDFSDTFQGNNNSSIRGYTFVSNCNATNFYKPSTENIKLKLFYTRVSDESLISIPDDINYIFSITGIDKYKVMHPNKNVIIPILSNLKTVNLTLATYTATQLDSRNRAFKFSNINLRNLIGNSYSQNQKFALICKSYISCEYNTSYLNSFSGYTIGNIFISGFNWITQSIELNNVNRGSVVQQFEINSIHQTPASVLCQVNYNFSTNDMRRAFKESYIENVFEISNDNIDIVLSNTPMYFYGLTLANNSTTDLFPHYVFNLDIIPVD